MDFVVCELCGSPVGPEGHYVVRMDVFADPALPSTTIAKLNATDFDREMAELMKKMKGFSADELADQVHKRFEFKICPKCHAGFLANPLGKPRTSSPADN